MCLFIYSELFAAPYFLNTTVFFRVPNSSQEYAIDKTVDLRPVYFGTQYYCQMDEQEKQKIDVQKAYNSWFKNLNDYITSQRRTEFQFMQEIIDFGMSEKAFIPTDDEILLFNDGLVICFDDRNNPACGISTIDAAGVFQKAINNMRISVRKAYPPICKVLWCMN